MMSKRTVVWLVSLVLLGFLFFTLSRAEDTPVLPDFTKEPYKIVDSGRTTSLCHPEFGTTESILFAYVSRNGSQKTRSFIAIFFKADGTYKYAEWVLEKSGSGKTEVLIRGYNYIDGRFLFEQSKEEINP